MSRRLFSSRITESGRFLKLPPSSQSLYFHMNMHADDDGIVEAYRVLKLTGANEGDMKALIESGFLVMLNSDLVTYIPHWLEHNVLRANRKTDSVYQHLLLKVVPDAEVVKSRPRGDTAQGRLYLEGITGQSSDSPVTVRGLPEAQSTKHKAQSTKITPLPPEIDFEAFYAKYPKHIARQSAKRAWDRICPTPELATTIISRLETHKASSQWVRDSGKFIPHPATWLNQRRWEDEIKSALQANKTIQLT